jgi:hypothetical protein
MINSGLENDGKMFGSTFEKLFFCMVWLCKKYRPHKTTTTIKANEPRKTKLVAFKKGGLNAKKQNHDKEKYKK